MMQQLFPVYNSISTPTWNLSMYSPEMSAKLAQWRIKAADGTITKEEMAEAITALRGERQAAATAPTGERKRSTAAKKAPVNSDDLLSQLEGL